MKNLTYAITMIVSFIIVLAIIIIAVGTSKETIAPRYTENCKHNFVITSKYDYFRGAYKTVSKCTKCGEIIE